MPTLIAPAKTVAAAMSPHPILVHPDTRLGEVWALMNSHGIASCPVILPNGALEGMVSRVDLLQAFRPSRELGPAEVQHATNMLVRDVMHYGVITLSPEDLLLAAVDRFVESRMHLLPVVRPDSSGHQVVGVLTQGDVLRHLVLGEQG